MMNGDVGCPVDGCSGTVERIKRYKVTVEWERSERGWELGTYDDGSHFHLFCSRGHQLKRWGRDLPIELQQVVFPIERDAAPEQVKRPSVPYGAPRSKKEWDSHMERFEPK